MRVLQTAETSIPGDTIPQPWRDPLFWLVVSAAPLAWLILYLWTAPTLAPEAFWANPQSLALLLVLSPLAEEWLFRGRIQGSLLRSRLGRRQWAGITSANFITSLLFVLLHMFNHPPQWALLVLFPSLLFGLLRDRYGRIESSILLHAFYNAGYFSIWPPA